MLERKVRNEDEGEEKKKHDRESKTLEKIVCKV